MDKANCFTSLANDHEEELSLPHPATPPHSQVEGLEEIGNNVVNYFIQKLNHNKRRPHRHAKRRMKLKNERTPDQKHRAALAATTKQQNYERKQRATKTKREEEEGISATLLAFTNQLTNQLSAAENATHPQTPPQNYTKVADAPVAAIEREAVERVRARNNKGANNKGAITLTEDQIGQATLAGTIPSVIPDSGASDTCVKTK